MYLKLLEKGVKHGMIHMQLPNGDMHTFGHHGLEATWIINDENAIKRIAKDWEWELGETYIAGGWDVADGELRDLLSILRANFAEYNLSPWLKPFATMLHQWNKVSRSYINASHHYDLEEDFFRLFLDKEMHYSCAYFSDARCSLEDAQRIKCEHIAKKLILKPGQRVLDIGCGWGSLALYLAEQFDVEVIGITLSKQQLAVAQRRAKERGLEHKVHFKLEDYREHVDCYDRIVSIGMFEHVGQPFHQVFFDVIKSKLHDEGIALIHTIGHSGAPQATNPWIRKHIFPGGCIPALSEMIVALEKAELMLADAEILRLHYAQTLRAWSEQFKKHRNTAREQKGEEFCRMWEFYLEICNVAFQHSDLVVFQLQIAKQHNIIPPTRDYLYTQQPHEYIQTEGM